MKNTLDNPSKQPISKILYFKLPLQIFNRFRYISLSKNHYCVYLYLLNLDIIYT